MLETIRNHTGSIVVKILFGLLILSFAAWGVGDMINQATTPDAVAVVGEEKISPQNLRQEYSRELYRLRTQFGQTIDSEQAKSLGIMEVVLNRLVTGKLYDAAVKDLGVVVSDALVLKEVQGNPQFLGITNQFDRAKLQQVLMNNGLNEDEYLRLVGSDLLRRPLLSGVDSGSAVPTALFEPLYAFEKEKRKAEMILIATEEMPAPAAPDDEILKEHHKDNPKAFTAPEYRKLALVNVALSDLAAKEDVSDEAISEAYEARKEEYQTPQKRDVQQMVFLDEKGAKAAHDRLIKGDDFVTVAKEVAGQEEDSLSLGTMTYEEMPKAIADAAFGIPQGGFSVPVKSPLGWHLIRVAKVIRETQKPLEEAKGTIKEDLAKEKALETQFDLFKKVEDELAGGATLEELSSKLGLTLQRLNAMDQTGVTPSGSAVTGLPKGIKFFQTAFARAQGAPDEVTENGDDGFFIVRVDGVTPPALRPFDTVKDKVLEHWSLAERAKTAENKAKEALERLKGGVALATVAKDLGIEVEGPAPFGRTGGNGVSGTPLPGALIQAAFGAKKGKAVIAPSPDGHYVAVVTEVEAPKASADLPEVKDARFKLEKSIGNDLLIQLAAALRKEYAVRVNRTVVDQLY